jgi:hypothetical protein
VLSARSSSSAAGAADAGEPAWLNVVAASAEGYAFPTNLDRDQPVDGMAPPTQADLVRRALAERWDVATFEAAVAAQAERRESTL